MKVLRILTAVAGHPCGAVVEASDADAASWIGRGVAEVVRGAAGTERATAEPQAERATADPSSARRGRGRGGRRG
jgi:hypothetical protein